MPAVPVPMTLTQQVADIYAQLKRLRTATSAGGGFDPNENPVIIGAGAASGTSGTPNAPSGGATSSVTIGPGAYTGDDYCVAIGQGADAEGLWAVAIGTGASTWAGSGQDYTVAIGGSAAAKAQFAVAIGVSSRVNATSGVAFGNNTTVASGHTHASAIGPDAATTKAHQIMLGTSADFVEIPGNGTANGLVLKDTSSGTRYIVQITAGALVLNTAP